MKRLHSIGLTGGGLTAAEANCIAVLCEWHMIGRWYHALRLGWAGSYVGFCPMAVTAAVAVLQHVHTCA
jgi:hypothetical protein